MNSEPHLDAETLAAWAEDRLSAAERDALEAHAADCGRCQALLAAMVRTEPPLSESKWSALSERSESKWWRRISPLGWAVPLTAAAAAVIWLVASPVTNREPKVVVETAQVAEESPSPTPVPSLSSRLADEVKAKPERQELARNKDAALDKLQIESGAAGALAGAAPAPAGAPAPAPAAPAAQAPALQPPAEAAKAERAAGADAAKERASTVNEMVTRTNSLSVAPMAKALAAVPLPEIVSSNPASRWRITRTPGLLQHSTDGGATWEPQQTNVPVELTAGASPQPSVCWMVGRAGLVLLSTDARSWRRVPFIQTTDLVAVSATDDSHATVTTSGGDKFVTADGGATWERAPVQEIPATPF